MAAVLVVTHAAGVVHRDLKPGNVMITGGGDAKVLDFGLAHSIQLGARDHAAAHSPTPPRSDDETIGALDVEVTRRPSPAAITGWSALPTADQADFHTRAGQCATLRPS